MLAPERNIETTFDVDVALQLNAEDEEEDPPLEDDFDIEDNWEFSSNWQGETPSTLPWASWAVEHSEPLPSPFMAVDGAHLGEGGKAPTTGQLARRQRKNERRRKMRRVEREEKQRALHTTLKKVARQKAAQAKVIQLPDKFSLDALRVCSTGWAGIRTQLKRENPEMFELLGEDYELKLVDWNGTETHAIVDKNGVVIAVLAARPADDDWDNLMREAAARVEKARAELHFTDKQLYHRRGPFPVISVGVSFGGGQQRPGNLRQSSQKCMDIMKGLLDSTPFRRLAGLANSMFQAFAEKTYSYYKTNLDRLYDSDRRLLRNFTDSVFAACTFNFGPKTVTWPHTDFGNLSFGWCSITAFGDFDPDKGGHFILWELGLVIRFPPGSTILLPSAILFHSNVPIQQNEKRYSFVQYSASGLFRWVHNNFRSDKEAKQNESPEEAARRKEADRKRWDKGSGMFSTWQSIVDRATQ